MTPRPKTLPPLSGLIFDFDGTLADTLPLCIAAFRAATEPLVGHPVSDESIVSSFGPSEEGAVHKLAPNAPEACLKGYLHHYEELHASMAPHPFPGISETLDALDASGLRLGLVTGKGRGTLEISMRAHDLTRHFDEVRVGCPEGPCKPAKIREILDVWGLDAATVGYVGDVPHDVASAREAGCLAISAAWASSADPDALAAAKPDALFTSLDEFRREVLRAGTTS